MHLAAEKDGISLRFPVYIAKTSESTYFFERNNDMKRCYGFLLLALVAMIGAGTFAQQSHPPGDILSQLMFTSMPPQNVSVGEKYTYKAVAVSRDSAAVIRYSVRLGVKGFAIDSVTGVVNWTPDAKGWFAFSILATSNKGGKATQDFVVEVAAGNGIIQGTITDTLNNPIAQVLVEAMNTQSIIVGSPSSAVGGSFSYSAMTDKSGKYRIARIEPGTYKLHANAPTPNFQSQWYDGKDTPALANVVTVRDTPNVTIADFKLRGGIPQLKTATVKGLVTDTLGRALKSVIAQVVFVRAGFALNTNGSVEDFRMMFDGNNAGDFRLDGASAYVILTKTDSTGAYKLSLPVGSYIAYAGATGYVTEYFLHQADIRSATTINLQKDSSGINFRLAALPPVVLGRISGSVTDSSKGIGVRSRVVVIGDNWTLPSPTNVARSYTVDTDSLGVYTANNLVPGTYIVLAIPMGSYAPAYYTTDTANTRWKKATKIVINGNTFTGAKIYVRALNPTVRGYSGVSGNVRTGTQSAVSGAIVYAFLKNSVAGYAIVDNNGAYQISGVSPNSYTVTVDMPGYEETTAQAASASYLANGSPSFASVNFSLASVVTAVETNTTTLPAEFTLGQNYPNPFNPSTSISYQLPANSTVTLKVFDILGKELLTLVQGQQVAGSYVVRFDASHFASGVYLYQLRADDGSGSGSKSLIQTRKMVLLK